MTLYKDKEGENLMSQTSQHVLKQPSEQNILIFKKNMRKAKQQKEK